MVSPTTVTLTLIRYVRARHAVPHQRRRNRVAVAWRDRSGPVGDGGGRPLSVPCASKGEAVLRRRFKEVVAAANRKTKERDDIQAKLAVANARISQLESTTHWTDTIRGQQNIIDGLQARIQELENCKSTDDMDDFVLAKTQEIMRLRKANAQLVAALEDVQPEKDRVYLPRNQLSAIVEQLQTAMTMQGPEETFQEIAADLPPQNFKQSAASASAPSADEIAPLDAAGSAASASAPSGSADEIAPLVASGSAVDDVVPASSPEQWQIVGGRKKK